MSQKLKIEVPTEVIDKYHLQSGDGIKLTLRAGDALVKPMIPEESQPSSVWWAIIPALLSAVFFYGYFLNLKVSQLKLTGERSIATAVIILGVITGILLFGIFFVKSRRHSDNIYSRYIYWRNFPTIVISFALMLSFALLGIFWVFGTIFDGASFDLVTAMIIFFVFNAMSNYFMILAARSLSTTMLTSLLILVITTGVIISMASNSQRRWWQYNLSFLGTQLASNSWQFNLTLIFSALLTVALVDLLFVSLQHTFHNTWRLITLRILLTLTAVDLGAVGVFTNDAQFHVLHDWLARILVYLIIILIVGIRWLLPKINTEFLMTSYIIGVILFVGSLTFQVFHYWSLTAFEIVSFILAFGWILLLFEALQLLVKEATSVFMLKLE